MPLASWLFVLTLFTDSLTGPASAVDGDSLFVAEREVRLFGVDAWEWRQTCPDRTGRLHACGEEAARFLQSLVDGQTVTCDIVTRDKYQRLVASCHPEGGGDVGSALVRAGHGVAFTRYSDRYLEEESQARREKAGGWRGLPDHSPMPPEKWRRKNSKH